MPVLVDAGLHLHQLVLLEFEGVEAGHQSLEAPGTVKETRVFDNVKPGTAVDVDQKPDDPLQLLIVLLVQIAAAVQPILFARVIHRAL